MPRTPASLERCVDALRERGMLPVLHKWLPTARALVAREFPDTSGEPDAHGAVVDRHLEELAAHRDVLRLKLLVGRPTLVHRNLWPDLLAMALSGADWQVNWLSRHERELLDLVESEGCVTRDVALAERLDAAATNLGNELESRLLVLGRTVRGEGLAVTRDPALVVDVGDEHGVAPAPDEEAARLRLEAVANALGPGAALPWRHRKGPRGRR